jgi:hypothetical protein
LTLDSILAMPSSAGAHNTLATEDGLSPTVPVLGGENSPAVPPGSNDPGLNQTSVFSDLGAKMKSHHWVWVIGAIVLILLALWYFGSQSSSAS